MEPPGSCQSCRQAVTESRLEYRKGAEIVHNAALLQCDICERFACADCLKVYDIYSGYDFICHECAHELESALIRRRLPPGLTQSVPFTVDATALDGSSAENVISLS